MQAVLILVMVAGVVGGIIGGVPVMFVLVSVPLFTSIAGYLLGVFDLSLLGAMPARIFGIAGNPLLQSIPMFILMGKILERSGVAEDLFQSCIRMFSNRRLSTVLAVVGIGVLIAASSGIVGATIVMLGAIALPAMTSQGITERLSAGLICASGTLGQLIPPSIVLILLSDQVSNAFLQSQRDAGNLAAEPVTIAHVFSGAILPGLLLAVMYALFAASQARGGDGNLPARQKAIQSGGTFPLAAMLGLIILTVVPISIIAGIASVTEAAVLGAAGTVLVTFVSGKPAGLPVAIRETIETTGVIFGIIVGASFFALVLRGFDGDILAASSVSAIAETPHTAVIFVMVVVFLLGFVLEFIEITYIVVPIAAPILFMMGVDPVWFTVMMAVNLQMSFLTPPMGVALFYYKTVSPISVEALFRSALPYVAIQLVMMIILFIFPSLATWLPELLV